MGACAVGGNATMDIWEGLYLHNEKVTIKVIRAVAADENSFRVIAFSTPLQSLLSILIPTALYEGGKGMGGRLEHRPWTAYSPILRLLPN